jgi:hypothetical protein
VRSSVTSTSGEDAHVPRDRDVGGRSSLGGERIGSQRPRQATCLVKTRAGDSLGLLHVMPRPRRIGIERHVGRLEVGHHAGKPLGERVVDLARQAAALLEDALFPLGCGELAARPLEFVDELPALQALPGDRPDPERDREPEDDLGEIRDHARRGDVELPTILLMYRRFVGSQFA